MAYMSENENFFKGLVGEQVAVKSLILTTFASAPEDSPDRVFEHWIESPVEYGVDGESEDFTIFRAITI